MKRREKAMLDQYRKDFPAEDKDLLPDNDSPMGRKKFLFLLTSVAFAAVLFLLMMGTFSKGDDSLSEKVAQADVANREAIAQLETKLQGLGLRLEKIEQEAETLKLSVKETPKKQAAVQEVVAQAPFASPEDAIQMTSDALKKFIAKEAQASAPEVATVKGSKGDKGEIAKGKNKSKKPKNAVAFDPNLKVYTVQKGDTLSKISQRYFGTPNRWKSIYDANRDRIANINQLKVGTQIVIPETAKDG
jgi:nucleoid-associated protein YgaU